MKFCYPNSRECFLVNNQITGCEIRLSEFEGMLSSQQPNNRLWNPVIRIRGTCLLVNNRKIDCEIRLPRFEGMLAGQQPDNRLWNPIIRIRGNACWSTTGYPVVKSGYPNSRECFLVNNRIIGCEIRLSGFEGMLSGQQPDNRLSGFEGMLAGQQPDNQLWNLVIRIRGTWLL